jgi:hypothetical protein
VYPFRAFRSFRGQIVFLPVRLRVEDKRLRGVGGVTRGHASFRALSSSRKAAKPQKGTQKSCRGTKDDERMPGGWGTWPRTPIGGDRARSGEWLIGLHREEQLPERDAQSPCRLIGSIPTTDTAGTLKHRYGANAAQDGAATALNRILSRRCKPFESNELRDPTALAALGR